MHAAKFVLSPARPSHCEITVFVERAGQSVQASICVSGFVCLAIRVFFFACFGHSPVWSRFSAMQLRCDCSHAEINVFVFLRGCSQSQRRNRCVRGRPAVVSLFTVIFTRFTLPFLQILPTAAVPFSHSGFTIWISQTVYCYF